MKLEFIFLQHSNVGSEKRKIQYQISCRRDNVIICEKFWYMYSISFTLFFFLLKYQRDFSTSKDDFNVFCQDSEQGFFKVFFLLPLQKSEFLLSLKITEQGFFYDVSSLLFAQIFYSPQKIQFFILCFFYKNEVSMGLSKQIIKQLLFNEFYRKKKSSPGMQGSDLRVLHI